MRERVIFTLSPFIPRKQLIKREVWWASWAVRTLWRVEKSFAPAKNPITVLLLSSTLPGQRTHYSIPVPARLMERFLRTTRCVRSELGVRRSCPRMFISAQAATSTLYRQSWDVTEDLDKAVGTLLKTVFLKEIECKMMDCIHIAESRVHEWDLLNVREKKHEEGSVYLKKLAVAEFARRSRTHKENMIVEHLI